MTDILTSTEAANILGLKPKSLSRICSEARIPFTKKYGRLYFSKSRLEDFMATGEDLAAHLRKNNKAHLKVR